MKRRGFFGRILAAFGAVAADKVIARTYKKPLPTPSTTNEDFRKPSVTPSGSVTPTVTPTKKPQPTPRVVDGYAEYWRWDDPVHGSGWVRDWNSKR